MFALALTALKRNIALYAIIVLVVVMLEMLMQSATGVVTLVFAGLAMLYTHRFLQLDEVRGWADPMGTIGDDGSKIPVIGYLLRFMALFLALILCLTAAFMALDASGLVDLNAIASKIELALWGMGIGLPLFAVGFALIGTVLPACAERGNTSLIAAMSRGGATFARTFLNLLLGPMLAALVAFMLMGQIGWWFGNADAFAARLGLRTLATILSLPPAILCATALSIAYLDSQKR